MIDLLGERRSSTEMVVGFSEKTDTGRGRVVNCACLHFKRRGRIVAKEDEVYWMSLVLNIQCKPRVRDEDVCWFGQQLVNLETYKLVPVVKNLLATRRTLSEPSIHIFSLDLAQSHPPLHARLGHGPHIVSHLCVFGLGFVLCRRS